MMTGMEKQKRMSISDYLFFKHYYIQGLFLLLSKVIFFVEYSIFTESYLGGSLFFTEARPFWPMVVKIIQRLFINMIFNLLWEFFKQRYIRKYPAMSLKFFPFLITNLRKWAPTDKSWGISEQNLYEKQE